MNLLEMRTEVARNANILSSDDATIAQGTVTSKGIDNKINQIYRDVVGQQLIDKYPDDFEDTIEPTPTNRASFTVDAASSGSTLVSTSAVFANLDEGFEVQNGSTLEKLRITRFNSPTTVTVQGDVPASWVGATVYILFNKFTFEGDAADLKEIRRVRINWTGNDLQFRSLRLLQNLRLAGANPEGNYSTSDPVWYPTTVKEGGSTIRAIGILPYPTNYNGRLQYSYTARPRLLRSDIDVPQLEVMGISEVLIQGASAWACGVLREWDAANQYMAMYDRVLAQAIRSYKPRSRGHTFRRSLSPFYQRMARNTIIENN